MTPRLLAFALLIPLCAGVGTILWAAGNRADTSRRTPVVVELFTSEGCSSCPPADALLSELARTQPVDGVQIVPLAFHVDYWDERGWRDPYSAADWSQRQRRYARDLGSDRVYTPQMLVDGGNGFVGSARDKAMAAVAESRRRDHLPVSLAAQDGLSSSSLELSIGIGKMQGGPETAEVLVAVTEDGLQSDVARGENAGRRIRHDGVVRDLRVAGMVRLREGGRLQCSLALDPRWKRSSLAAVAFAHDPSTRRILGTAVLRLE